MHWDYEISKPLEDYSKTGAVKLSEEYDPKKFYDLVPSKDTSGREMPSWKRQLMARQMAEKSLKEDEERTKLEAEEARYRDMPAWKRSLLEKKDTESKAKVDLSPTMENAISSVKLTSPSNNNHDNSLSEKLDNLDLDEDGLPMAPWQLEMKNKKQVKTKEG